MKSSQKPLTGTPSPALDWSRDSAPASADFDDIYFSVDGGLEETQNVFLKGNKLPERWNDRPLFCVGELGFGSGLNFLACWDEWQRSTTSDQILHFISVEAFPWRADDLRQALQKFPKLSAYWEPLIAQWPGPVKGMHRLHFGNVHLTLMHMDAQSALSQYHGPGIDAWFLDGFSPSKNPDMWSQEILDLLARHSAPNATIGTFTVAGHVRRGLQDAGFEVVRKPGFGRKRHRLEASFTSPKTANSTDTGNLSPIIIGAGIAGASIAKAFARRGITPVLLDPNADLSRAASGNPAALVMPRLDVQDRPESRFFLNAFLYATRLYESDGQILQTGALQLAKSEDEQNRFEKIAKQAALSSTDMSLISPKTAEEILGHPVALPFAGLNFPRAQTIDPKATIARFTAHAEVRQAKVSRIVQHGDEWVVFGENDQELARSKHIFVTPGANILDIEPLASLPVRFTRGQISWGTSDMAPEQPVTFGGYALKFADGVMLGATHDHVGPGQSNETCAVDDAENVEKYARIVGQPLELAKPQSRAGVRVTTKDTLPISTEFQPGLFVMTGLGSRGFMMAPLLGEALVSDALGEPSPLTIDTKMRFGTREKI